MLTTWKFYKIRKYLKSQVHLQSEEIFLGNGNNSLETHRSQEEQNETTNVYVSGWQEG